MIEKLDSFMKLLDLVKMQTNKLTIYCLKRRKYYHISITEIFVTI